MGTRNARTGLEGGFGGRRGHGIPSPTWWEVVYIRSEGERQDMCLVFLSNYAA